jgi:hypothetical protein
VIFVSSGGKQKKKYLKKIMTEKFPNLMKTIKIKGLNKFQVGEVLVTLG